MAPETSPAPQTAQIMIVEDEVLIRTSIAGALRDTGFQVIEAADADEAWTYLSTGATVDLIFSDVNMPGSMDGVELARRVAEVHPKIAFVLTSGGRTFDPSEHPHFLAKPYRIANLVAMIASLLQRA